MKNAILSILASIQKLISYKIYYNKFNNVKFKEIIRFENESVMLRTDINIRLLIPHKELEKNYSTKKLDK